MHSDKKVKDLMIGVFDYPHIPYWFSIDQAMKIIKASFIKEKKYTEPLAILVFDEKYNLLGTLTLKDILRGLEPRFMRPTDKAQAYIQEGQELSLIWDTLFASESKELAQKPVNEIMVPTKYFVEPDDSIAKAAYLMIHDDLPLLPVLEAKKKFVGLVRMIEIFDELTNVIIKE
jgi:CBS-domain-containing membrane protein